jgi:hypothetical protein
VPIAAILAVTALAAAAHLTRKGSRAARASRDEQYMSATLTQGHMDEPAVRAARQVARRALTHGQKLGEGFFGVAYLVDGRVVKLPRYEVPYRPRKSLKEARAWLLHEAGVANELSESGFSIIPEIVYVELEDGSPALVREYGEPAGKLSAAELHDLERQLWEIEQTGTEWDVADDLLLLRRKDGTVFVGDVGFWRARSEPRKHDHMDSSDIPLLMSKWAYKEGMGKEFKDALGSNFHSSAFKDIDFWLDELEKAIGTDDPVVELFTEDLGPEWISQMSGRKKLGLYIRPEVRDAMDRMVKKLDELGMEIELPEEGKDPKRFYRIVKKRGAIRKKIEAEKAARQGSKGSAAHAGGAQRRRAGAKPRPGRAQWTGWSCVSGPEEMVAVIKRRTRDLSYGQAIRRMDLKGGPAWWFGMPTDWAVSYWETELPSGRSALVMQHSGIEYLFTDDGSHDDDEAGTAVRLVEALDRLSDAGRVSTPWFEDLSDAELQIVRAAARVKR